MGKSFSILLIGASLGVLGVLAYKAMRDRDAAKDADALAERISERLAELEEQNSSRGRRGGQRSA